MIKEKHSLVLRLCHWINIPLMLLMIWSGVLIYWANQAYVKIPANIGPFQIHHRLAEGMGWHFFLMWPLAINGIIYISYLLISGEWRRLKPGVSPIKEAIGYLKYELKLTQTVPIQKGIYNPVQKLAYLSAIFMGVGLIVTGIAIHKPVQMGWLTNLLGGYEAARLEHFILMIAFSLFIIIHVFQVIRAGWNNFRAMVAGYEIHGE